MGIAAPLTLSSGLKNIQEKRQKQSLTMPVQLDLQIEMAIVSLRYPLSYH